jgi:hypothetical protein
VLRLVLLLRNFDLRAMLLDRITPNLPALLLRGANAFTQHRRECL